MGTSQTEAKLTTLEQMRQKAQKASKRMFRIPIIVFVVLLIYQIFRCRYFFVWLATSGIQDSATIGGLFMLIGGVLLSATWSGVVFLIYYILIYQKAYQKFNLAFKQEYVMSAIAETPGFSDLQYTAGRGFTYDEMQVLDIVPCGVKNYFKSSDNLTGVFREIRFRAGNITTSIYPKGRSSMPDEVFSGQVIGFSLFDEKKISQSRVQIFPKKLEDDKKPMITGDAVETENAAFHNMFSVYAEDEHNAFYILTPQVLEKLMLFQQQVNDRVYFLFDGSYMFIACQQNRNPFDGYVDIPMDEQAEGLKKGTQLIESARDILVSL